MRIQRGFTLIELLVVIAIIGILATLVITQLSGATTKARNSRAQSDVTEAGKGMQVFLNDDTASGSVISTAGSDVKQGGTSAFVTLAPYFTGTNVFTSGSATYSPLINSTPSTAYTYKYDAGLTTDAARGLTANKATSGIGSGYLYRFCSNTAAVGTTAAGSFGTNDTGNDNLAC